MNPFFSFGFELKLLKVLAFSSCIHPYSTRFENECVNYRKIIKLCDLVSTKVLYWFVRGMRGFSLTSGLDSFQIKCEITHENVFKLTDLYLNMNSYWTKKAKMNERDSKNQLKWISIILSGNNAFPVSILLDTYVIRPLVFFSVEGSEFNVLCNLLILLLLHFSFCFAPLWIANI